MPTRTQPLEHPYWTLPPEQLLQELETSPTGLSALQARQRLITAGPNRLERKQRLTRGSLLLQQFKSPILLILLFATTVSAILKDWVDALLISAIVLSSALLSFMQEWRANNAADALRSQVTAKTTVLRDGKQQKIPLEEIVPGDVVLLAAGTLIPADGVMLEAKNCYVNQAVLTGETFPVEKRPEPVAEHATLAERTNCVFLGTNVRSGTGRAVIVHTGQQTAFGEIAHSLVLRPPETEFEQGIRRFGHLLSEVMIFLVLIVFAVNVAFAEPVLDSLLFSVALAVGLTPQLLPAIISITLAQGSQKMASQGVIVRRLESIENFGSMDVLCTDKTGTLTLGVVRLDGALDIHGQPSTQLFYYAYLNAHFQTGLANTLDDAILAAEAPDIRSVTKIDELPYDFVRKRLSIVVQNAPRTHSGDSEQNPKTPALMIAKGALDNILAVSTRVQDGDHSVPLDAPHIQEIQRLFAEWNAQGYRVLGVATKETPLQPHYSTADEKDFTFQGILLFFDPPKAGVRETIDKLESLGVRVKIITGDNKLVAMHTAQEVDVPIAGVLTGSELANLRDEALWHAVDRTDLFAEVDPNQKERIILALKKRGHVVGYMGDGINDAPPLHAADVGISVNTAVDVAKEAADFVLLENSLESLHQGIVLGRKTFANTLKYVFITTSANFGNMFTVAGASLFLPFLPMLPLQILITNFLSDMPAMTIATDFVDQELVVKPRRWDIRYIRDFMITFGLVSTVFDYMTFFLLLYVLRLPVAAFRTGWFIESILSELLILLVIRTRQPFFKSMPAIYLLLASAAVAVVTLWLPFSPWSELLGLSPLPFSTLLLIGGILVLYVAMSEVAKRYFYRWHM
jgi:Mg2+-importing ATPase